MADKATLPSLSNSKIEESESQEAKPKRGPGRPKKNTTQSKDTPIRFPRNATDPAKPKPEQEDRDKITKLQSHLRDYYEHWSFLKDTSSGKGKIPEDLDLLVREIHRCKQMLKHRQAYMNCCRLNYFVDFLMEKILMAQGIPAHGLAFQAKQSEDLFQDELMELSIEYKDWFSTGPLLRFMIGKAQLYNKVIDENKKKSQFGDTDYNNKFSDL